MWVKLILRCVTFPIMIQSYALLTVKFLRKPLQGEAIPASLIVTIPASCDIVVPQPMQTSSSNDSINSLGWFGRLDTSMWIFKVQRNTLGGCCTCYAKHVIIDRTMANWRVTSMSSSILSLNTNWITVLESWRQKPLCRNSCRWTTLDVPAKNGAIGLARTLHNMRLV